ncbi:MAG: MBL fold metallo-hydrolase [Magnetococcales bacterium]|nr:MBL fold metallo-hydrolase [Magnetococcales bacterium]
MNSSIKIDFLGVGSAFTTQEYHQPNLLITAKNGKRLLVDCGSDIRFSLGEWGKQRKVGIPAIDAVYCSHTHADHIGGLEWLAFDTYFNPQAQKPVIYGVGDILKDIWERSLRGGVEFIDDKVMTLEDYFDPMVLDHTSPFVWEGVQFIPLKFLHVQNSVKPMYSYGLIINSNADGDSFLFTTDTKFTEDLAKTLIDWEPRVKYIFQDTETTPYQTGVHAHYSELCTLPESIKNKMWLYHHNPNPKQKPLEDGFLGFVKKGQSFLT